MAILPILHYPDSRLKTKAEPVKEITSEIQTLIDNMFDTMYHDNGIGLAATQVNVHLRIMVMDIASDKSQVYHFINPEILESEGTELSEEGCLSVPGVYEKVERKAYIEAVHALFDHLNENNVWSAALKSILLHLDTNYRLTEALLVNLLKKREQWLNHLSLSQVDEGLLRQFLEKGLTKTINEELSALYSLIPGESHSELALLTHFASQYAPERFNSSYFTQSKLAPPTVENEDYWQSIKNLLLTQQHEFRKQLTIREGFPAGKTAAEKRHFQEMKTRMLTLIQQFSACPGLLQQLLVVSHLPSMKYEDRQWQILQDLLVIMPVLLAHLTLIFQKTNQIDCMGSPTKNKVRPS